MLTLFKKIFGRAEKKPATPLLSPAGTPPPGLTQFESTIQSAKIEVARLSLVALVAKFPEDVRALIAKAPDEKATVALPIQTIVMQLPSGVVRMSLASLHRQAPPGVFKPLPAGDKRMIEVPLVEVFKHVKPTVFKRRADQRSSELPPEDLALFNDRHKPKADAPAAAPKAAPAAAKPPVESASKPIAGLVAPPPEGATMPAPTAMRVVAPPSDFKVEPATPAAAKPAETKPAPASEASPGGADAPLVLPIAPLSAQWPDPIRKELAALDPATTEALPTGEVKSGLARGRIALKWGQIHSALTPQPSEASSIEPSTELLLPLKVVAPAFLAQSKRPGAPRKSVEVDATIPALFNKSTAQPVAEAVLTPLEEPVVEAAPATEEDRSQKTEPALSAAEGVSATAPSEEGVRSQESEVREDTPTANATTEHSANENSVSETPANETPVAEPPIASAAAETPAEPAPTTPASGVGAAFGEPEKDHWTPAELVARVVKLPGVAGAVIALQEGFQVAQALPEGINAETVSAFLPQIFGRLNQYAGEMKLGEVDDLLFTTRGAHCLIYRLGTLYFAVLGQPGASLPWHQLRLVAAELSRQVQK